MAALVAGVKLIDPDDATSYTSKDGDSERSSSASPVDAIRKAFRAAWLHAGLTPARPCVLRISIPSVGGQNKELPASTVAALQCIRDSADPWSFSATIFS